MEALSARQNEWRRQMWLAFLDDAPTAVFVGLIVAFGVCAFLLPYIGFTDSLFLVLWLLLSTPAFALGSAFSACGFYPTATRMARAARVAEGHGKGPDSQ